MKRIIAAGAGCVLVSWNAGAQPAPPQMRTPWVDSTHITGVAKRVMPDSPVTSPPPDITPGPVSPASIQELLDRMNGVQLYFREIWDGRSGWNELPAVLRVEVRGDGAEIQSHGQWNNYWAPVCVLNPTNTRCVFSPGSLNVNLVMEISSSAITIVGASCSAWTNGSANAWATYTWEQYSASSGKFSNQNRSQQSVNNGYSGYFFQRGSFQSSCYYEMPG